MSVAHYTPSMGYLSPCPLCGERRQNLLREDDGSFRPTTGCWHCQLDDKAISLLLKDWQALQAQWKEGTHLNTDMTHWLFKEKQVSRRPNGNKRRGRRTVKVMRVAWHEPWRCQVVTSYGFRFKGASLSGEYLFKLEEFVEKFKPVIL